MKKVSFPREGFVLLVILISLQTSAQITRQPYLQVPTPNSIVVRWNTEVKSVGTVHYGVTIETLTERVEEADSAIFHEVTLTGLEPDTKYYYAIDTVSPSEELYFKTAPPVGNKGKTRIWVISDFGQSDLGDNVARDKTINRWNVFNDEGYHADLVLSLGDQTENDLQEELTLSYFGQLEPVLLNSPLYTVEGNHDNYDGMVNYLATFSMPVNGEAGGTPSNTKDYYSFDYGNIHVVVLSTEINDINGVQLTWLKNDLQNIDKDTSDWLIACLHRPFHSGGYHPTDLSSTAQKQRTHWLAELEKYGVDLILQGHNAIYERSFLIDGLIGKTTDLTDTNIIDRGDGREDGDGVYYKGSGLNPHEGAIFIEVAPGGNSVTNNANYSIFSYAYSGRDIEGSVVIDVDEDKRMDVSFLCNSPDADSSFVWDYFSIVQSDSAISVVDSTFADQIHFSVISNQAITFDWVGTASHISYGTEPNKLFHSLTAENPDFLPVTSPWQSDPGPYWEAKLTGLEQNTLYYYKIGNNGEVHEFRTPPVPGTADFRICSTSDMHESSPACLSMFNQIAELKPDLVITTGDLTGAGPAGQQEIGVRFHTAMAWSQSAAWMPAWGNHDWEYFNVDDLRTAKGRFDIPNPQIDPTSPEVSCCGEDWGWFDYGNTRFISFPERWNTSTTWQNWATTVIPVFEAAQSDPNIKFIVTFGHQSAYTSARDRWGGSGTQKGLWNGLREAYSKYKLDLSGHNHQYERYHLDNGMTHIINSTAGSYYRGWDDPIQPTDCVFRAIHYGLLVLDFSESAIHGKFVCSVGTSKYGSDYKPLEEPVCDQPGTVIDEFTIYESDSVTAVGEAADHMKYSTSIRNYPNPFHLSTIISYSLKHTGDVRIEVYDSYGRKVSTLVDGLMEQGDHTVEWNAKDESGNCLQEGLYIARIFTGNKDFITRLMLM